VQRHQVDHVAEAAARRLQQLGELVERGACLSAHIPRRCGRGRVGIRAVAADEDQLVHLARHALRRHDPPTTASA
jgi:hypothetical protein